LSKLISITQAINTLREHYSFKSDTLLAKYLGISTTTLNSWKKRGHWNENNLTKISSKCVDINLDSLLRGVEYVGKNTDEEKVLNEEVLEKMLFESQENNKKLLRENLLLRKEVNRLVKDSLGYKEGTADENLAAEP